MRRSLWVVLLLIGCSTKEAPESDSILPVTAGRSGSHASAGNAGSGANGAKAGQGAGAAGSAPSAGAGGSATAGTVGDADGGALRDASADAAAPSGSRSTGPGDWTAGDYPPDINAYEFLEISGVPGQLDYVRQYKVHVPPSYDPSVPTPLVFCIHGLGQDSLLFCITGAAMHEKSDEAGFILVMPNGYQNSWNAGTCCGGASTEQLDDVALFRAIFEEVGTHLNIDLDRVYATGLSNGGYMSYRLACEAADMVTAIAPGAGAIGINDIGGGTNPASDFTACTPSQPVSVLHIHGTADPLIAYSLQGESLMLMAENNGCALTSIPATQPTSAGDTRCVSYDGCPDGVELISCTVDQGGHCWFGSPDCGTGGGDIGLAIVGNNSDHIVNTDEVWRFFESVSR